MKTTRNVITKLCTVFCCAAFALPCMTPAHAEEVKTKNVIVVTIPTKRVDVANDECTLYVKLVNLRDLSEYNVRCLDKETGEEYINMDLAPLDGELQIPLAILPLGTYQVEITNRTTNLIIEIEKFDETSDIYYDPFSTSNDEVVR